MDRLEFEKKALKFYLTAMPMDPPLIKEKVVEDIRLVWGLNLRVCAPYNNGIIRVTAKGGEGYTEVDWEGYEEQEIRRELSSAISNIFLLSGLDAAGDNPLWVSIQFAAEAPRIELMLKMKEAGDARKVAWGDRDTGQDNLVVLNVMLLSALLFYRDGYKEIRNQPEDELRRRLYRTMGFEKGEILDLTNIDSIYKLIHCVARNLSKKGIDIGRLILEP